MDAMNTVPGAQPSKVHMWILILLGWTAVFSLLSVGLLLTKSTDSGLSDTELSAACQNGVLNGITTNLTRISEACSESEPATISYDVTINGTEYYPGFIAPAGWHVSGTMNADTYSISMGDRPLIVYSFHSDAPSETKIQLVSIPTPSTVTPNTQAAFVATLFPAHEFENVTTTSQTLPNGTLYTTEADQLYEIGSDVHQTTLHYFSSTKLVTMTYDNTADEDDWTMIKESIDWSTIK
jgi:hypothetical protein